ncbi:YraN family protein [Henriciella litoralis]|uniref:YraN family protein n=1 Tax=Henriciella litoralis TaxID=568102 RepID=UPI0009FE2510|nr:YraN family protein [Henriciella litoralis]
MTDGKITRQKAETRGRRAEQLAALWLRAKGYRILARRVRLPSGEIDLVARRGKIIAFIEVKARQTRRAGETAVSRASWSRINRAAESWMAKRPALASQDWRFDLIIICPRRLPVHLRDQWRPDFAPTRR